MAVNTHRGKPPVRAIVLVSNWIILLSVCLGVVERVVALKECEVDVVVVAGGEQHTFTEDSSKAKISQITLFGKVEDGFEGFSINVEGTGGIVSSAWFPADHECFPDKDTWYQLLTFSQIKNNDTTIMFGFETRHCRKECKSDTAPQSLQQQSVEVYGASHWSEDIPRGDNCTVNTPKAIRFHGKHSTCSKRPTPMSTMNIIVVVLLVVVPLVGILLLILLYVIKKRAAPCPHTEGHTAKERLAMFPLHFWRRQQYSQRCSSSDDPANTTESG
ncbi:uncharacterized protein LOC123516430 isoform X2 [Portunus trituberculatus]|uniref:uncharacterized protein LOC123516430 isoform X2 n=1 Tax=Portunus trituberculatus TaxID=210409 RepID=UPI001E1CD6CB|nr:uncharacterized protein LOC123516430 isoform X2 [Portunus trituberculatus]